MDRYRYISLAEVLGAQEKEHHITNPALNQFDRAIFFAIIEISNYVSITMSAPHRIWSRFH